MIQDWYWATYKAMQDLWVGFLYFIPNLVGAVIVFVVGWFIASWAGIAITKVLNWLKLNQAFSKAKWDEALEKAGIKADVAGFIGQICRWILVITFLSASVEVLGLVAFAGLLAEVVAWLPNVIVVVLIMVVAVIVADILEKIVVASLVKAKIKQTHLASLIVKWSIYIFSLFAILMQLNIASFLIQTLFTGLVAILVIGGGLALGLGAKDVTKNLLEDLVRKLKD
ncbi:hypothetical protein L6250_02680 [Candidatus Parcubacteria bacterium]|nr:hypothetical protein [Patescibacteria group bacterium]MBU4466491.1 hypothetical protein [Patescibacteria group bacterium]MCG2688515.1 hypothetical protein [Candidatus Parcubacteria bacterium]